MPVFQVGHQGYLGLHMKYADGLLQCTLEKSRWSSVDRRTSAEVNWTKVSTILGHQIVLLGGGGTSELRSVVCTLVPLLSQVSSIYTNTILGSVYLYIC